MKKILGIRHKQSAVFNYRFDRPLGALGAKFRKTLLRKNEELPLGDLAKRLKKLGDIWVIKYVDHRHTLDVIYTMRDLVGAKVIVDIDDNVWQIPVGNISRGDIKTFSNRAMMTIESVKAADYVTVATQPLMNILKPLNENIAVLPNLINPDDWVYRRKKHDKVRIGWVYSQTHTPDISVVTEALKTIHETYGDRVEICIFGVTHDIFPFPTTNIPPVLYTDYPKLFTEAGIDISLAPLADNEFNKCKSNIKWLESTMAGAAFIGSKVYPYETSVKQGKTGYVCSSKSQWVKYISWLVENEEKRAELVANAKKEVLGKYNFKTNTEWGDFYITV